MIATLVILAALTARIMQIRSNNQSDINDDIWNGLNFGGLFSVNGSLEGDSKIDKSGECSFYTMLTENGNNQQNSHRFGFSIGKLLNFLSPCSYMDYSKIRESDITDYLRNVKGWLGVSTNQKAPQTVSRPSNFSSTIDSFQLCSNDYRNCQFFKIDARNAKRMKFPQPKERAHLNRKKTLLDWKVFVWLQIYDIIKFLRFNQRSISFDIKFFDQDDRLLDGSKVDVLLLLKHTTSKKFCSIISQQRKAGKKH
uniref:Uncharacterized protein n=1 Tax=Romanomermis culicivorax TaxID=13658 RepID=A0A915JMV4_ROMCU